MAEVNAAEMIERLAAAREFEALREETAVIALGIEPSILKDLFLLFDNRPRVIQNMLGPKERIDVETDPERGPVIKAVRVKLLQQFKPGGDMFKRHHYELRGRMWVIHFRSTASKKLEPHVPRIEVKLPLEGRMAIHNITHSGDLGAFHRDLVLIKMFKPDE